jgi:hypothetical protein
MALGLFSGRQEPGAPVEEHYGRIQALVNRFEEKYGSINCQTLTGCHLGTPEGQAHFRETNQLENCLEYTETVTQTVLDLSTG